MIRFLPHSRLADQLATHGHDPQGMLLVKEFESSLTDAEQDVAEEMVAGYIEREVLGRLALERKDFRRIRERVRRKAVNMLA